MEKETITVDIDTWNEMFDEINFLNALRAAGVDNWDGYDYAVDIYNDLGGSE